MAIPLHQIIVLGLNKKVLDWVKVCRPLSYGGLGIPDLDRTAISLRTRWIWRMRVDPLRPWRGLDTQLSKIELLVFDASTKMVVGDGETALFWLDKVARWEGHQGDSAQIPKRDPHRCLDLAGWVIWCGVFFFERIRHFIDHIISIHNVCRMQSRA